MFFTSGYFFYKLIVCVMPMCPVYWCESPCWKIHDLYERNRCLYFPVWLHSTVCTQLPKVHSTNLACQLPASFYGFSAMSVALTGKKCQEEKMVLSISCTIPYKTMATNVMSRAVEIYLWFISYRLTFFFKWMHIAVKSPCRGVRRVNWKHSK